MIDVRPVHIKVVNVTGVARANREDAPVVYRAAAGQRKMNSILFMCIIEGAVLLGILIVRYFAPLIDGWGR